MLNYVTHLGYFTTRKKRYQLKKSDYNVILQLFCFSILATLLLDIQQIEDWLLWGLAYLNKKVRFFFFIPKTQVSESFSLVWLYFLIYFFLEAVQIFKFYSYVLVQSFSKWYPLHPVTTPVTSYQFCPLFFILFMLFLPFCRYLMFTWMLKSRIIFQHNLIYMLLHMIYILYIIYHTHTHIYIHIYIYIYTYIYIYIHIYIYLYTLYICMYMYIWMYVYKTRLKNTTKHDMKKQKKYCSRLLKSPYRYYRFWCLAEV